MPKNYTGSRLDYVFAKIILPVRTLEPAKEPAKGDSRSNLPAIYGNKVSFNFGDYRVTTVIIPYYAPEPCLLEGVNSADITKAFQAVVNETVELVRKDLEPAQTFLEQLVDLHSQGLIGQEIHYHRLPHVRKRGENLPGSYNQRDYLVLDSSTNSAGESQVGLLQMIKMIGAIPLELKGLFGSLDDLTRFADMVEQFPEGAKTYGLRDLTLASALERCQKIYSGKNRLRSLLK
jgi:hypothetical protein